MSSRARRFLLPIVAAAFASATLVSAPATLADAPVPKAISADRPASLETLALQQPQPDWFGGRLDHDVFGYLPYWEMTDGIEQYLQYDLLSTIAFFGVPMNQGGGVSITSPGYQAMMSARATRITNAAHAAGVRTEVTFTSFGYRQNAQFFGDARHRATFVRRAVQVVQARGADGADLDIELISSHYYASFAALVRELKAALTAVNPNAQVSVATNANTSGAKMAALAVANGADRVFMMGYDYRWSGSMQSGSIDPLVSANGGLSLSKSVDLYRHYGVPLDKVVLGLGYYGRSYPTASRRLRAPVQENAARFGTSTVFFPRSLPSARRGASFMYDRVEQAARLLHWDSARGTWIQTYYNDPVTLAAKLDLTTERSLAGMGIWALGYDRGQSGYWDAIDAAYSVPRPTIAVTPRPGTPNPGTGPDATGTVLVDVTVTAHGITSAPSEISLSNDGLEWSPWLPLAPNIPWTLAAGPDGPRPLQVQLRDATGASLTLTQAVTLDTAAPVVASPAISIPGRARAGLAATPIRVAWTAEDLSGVSSYHLEMSANGGPWVAQQLTSPSATSDTVLLASGSYEFRVSATDRAGNVSEPVQGAPFTVGLVQDSAHGVRLSKGWHHLRSTSVSGGTQSTSTQRGATATLHFSGTGIAVLGSIGPSRGGATVTIDGVVGSIDAGARGRSSRRVLYSKTLPPGQHTVVVRVYGTSGRPTVDLDAFAIVS